MIASLQEVEIRAPSAGLLGLLVVGIALVPPGLALARRVLPARPDQRSPWGFLDVVIVFLSAFVVLVLVGVIPGTGAIAGMVKMVAILLTGGLIAAARGRSETGDLACLGLDGTRVGRAAAGGLVGYVLAAPLVFAVTLIWPWLATRAGMEVHEQAILRAIVSLEPGGGLVPAVFLAVAVVPFLEELLFRGFLQPVLSRRLGVACGILVTSLLFAVLHGLEASGPIFVLSLLLGWLRAASGRLAAPAAAHAFHNAFVLTLAFAGLS